MVNVAVIDLLSVVPTMGIAVEPSFANVCRDAGTYLEDFWSTFRIKEYLSTFEVIHAGTIIRIPFEPLLEFPFFQ